MKTRLQDQNLEKNAYIFCEFFGRGYKYFFANEYFYLKKAFSEKKNSFLIHTYISLTNVINFGIVLIHLNNHRQRSYIYDVLQVRYFI